MHELQKAPTNSAPSLAERTEHRTWIKGRAATLLSHYWREDDDPALLAAIGKDWADVLEGIPQEFIQKACVQYQRDEPRRKPTPGAVYEIARKLMPTPKVVRSDLRPTTREEDAAYRERMARDRINAEKAEEAKRILAQAGLDKRMGQ